MERSPGSTHPSLPAVQCWNKGCDPVALLDGFPDLETIKDMARTDPDAAGAGGARNPVRVTLGCLED